LGNYKPSEDEKGDDRGRKEKRELSPWAEPPEEPKRRVVGWNAGAPVGAQDVKSILSQDKAAREAYRSCKKAEVRESDKQVGDRLKGLPATWQAFWSAVPHLDPKVAFREFQQKQAGSKAPVTKEEEAKEIVARLEAEVQAKMKVCAEHERIFRGWNEKLERERNIDKCEAEASRKVKKRLEDATYQHGVVKGQLRSLDGYFGFLHTDTQIQGKKEARNLERSLSLLQMLISDTKDEIRQMLPELANKLEPSVEGTASPASSESEHSL